VEEDDEEGYSYIMTNREDGGNGAFDTEGNGASY
jgi:hypothetical protein